MILVRDPLRLLIAIAVVVLACAMAFGLWHVVAGGMVNGNARAAGFGIVLASAAGGLLVGAVAAFHRVSRG